MRQETKEALLLEGKVLAKDVLTRVIITVERIITILITDTDNKLDDTFIPFIGKLKKELLEIVEGI